MQVENALSVAGIFSQKPTRTYEMQTTALEQNNISRPIGPWLQKQFAEKEIISLGDTALS